MTQNIKFSNQLDSLLPEILGDITKSPYSSSTQGIQVSVKTEFVDYQQNLLGSLFIWAYHVHITNQSKENVRLIKRYWKIIDEKGVIQEVSGEGVIGEKPTILPNTSFQYDSGVHLRHPSGIMGGHYEMQRENGEIFIVKIPTFSLDIPNTKSLIN